MLVEIVADGIFEFAGGTEAASTNLLLGERGKPAFHEIEPTSTTVVDVIMVKLGRSGIFFAAGRCANRYEDGSKSWSVRTV